MSEPVSFITRVSPEELLAYKEVALKAGISMNEWVKRMLNAVVKGDYRVGTPHTVGQEVLRACSPAFRPEIKSEGGDTVDASPRQLVKLCPRCQRIGQPACEACKKKAGVL